MACKPENMLSFLRSYNFGPLQRVFSVVQVLKLFLDRRASSDYSSSRRHDRDRDRDRDRDSRGRDWGRDRRHARDRDRNKERDHDRDRNKERDHDRDRHEEKAASSSGEKKTFIKGRNLFLMVNVMRVDIALQ